MSRIGRKAIAVPASVNVNIDADKVITVNCNLFAKLL